MDYISFELNISESSTLVTFGTAQFPDETKLGDQIREELIKRYPDSRAYGDLLFQSIFSPGSRALEGYSNALALARMQRKRLRFRLRIDPVAPAALNQITWELLYDFKNDIPIARSPSTAFSRDIIVEFQKPIPTSPSRLKMLFVLACPSDLDKYDLPHCPKEQMLTSLQTIMKQLDGAFDVKFLENHATPEAIRKAFTAANYDILHIHGHGILGSAKRESRLVLEDEQGKTKFVDERLLREILESINPPTLITLIACHTGQQSQLEDPFSGIALSLIKKGNPAVVAMNKSIGISTAEHFTRSFYSNLANTGTLDESINEARKMMYLRDERSSEWSVPVLYMRLTDGKILSPQAEPASVFYENQNEGVWRGILQQLRLKSLIPVVGPELNRGLLLSGPDIAKHWSAQYEYRKFNYPYIDRNDLPRIAKFVETKNQFLHYPHNELLELYKKDLLERENVSDQRDFSNMKLEEVISKVSLRYFNQDPGLPHLMLAKLNLRTIVTTNFDSFLREAILHKQQKKARVGICRWRGEDSSTSDYQGLQGSDAEPLIFHVFGYEIDSTSMVLTDDDYLDFSRRVAMDQWRIPGLLRSDMTTSTLLFLGYDVRDLDFRLLLKSVVAPLREIQNRVIVVQIDPAQYRQKKQELQQLQQIIERDAQWLRLSVHWSNLRSFIGELWDRSQQT